jgi:predicted phage terminase large subunit-like protein
MNYSEKVQVLRELQRRRRLQMEQSFHAFVREAFQVLHPGQTLVDNWHVEYLCGVLQDEIRRIVEGRKKEKDLIINVPPRSLKSFVTTVCLPAWAWTLDPRLKFIGSSYSSDLSIEHNMATRRLVESEWYQEYWGETVIIAADQNAKGKFETTLKGMRRSTSTGGTITGSGGDVIIIDDPTNPMLAASEVERKTANAFFDQTLTTRLNNPETGLFIIIMQRLHEEDLTGYLLKKQPDAYQHICIPAELSDNVKPASLSQCYTDGLFFPQRFTAAYLRTLKVSLGSYGYAGQMGQRPAPLEGGILKKDWFTVITADTFLSRVMSPTVHFFLDTAYTEDAKNDPTALLACCFANNNLYILESIQVWKELPDLIRFIPEFVNRNGYSMSSRILIEPKASGKSTVQSFKNTAYNVIELPSPTDSKLVRVNNITPFVEAGKCFLLEGNWNEAFVGECAAFPNGSHDDQVDCLTAAIVYGQKPTKASYRTNLIGNESSSRPDFNTRTERQSGWQENGRDYHNHY